jgi:hypothetical protein
MEVVRRIDMEEGKQRDRHRSIDMEGKRQRDRQTWRQTEG